MKRVLGLDLGTTSIGWAVVNQATNEDEQSSIIKLGVRVNPLTTDEHDNFEKGKSITTTADRTLKRGMRRNLSRYKLRRERLIQVLKREGFVNPDFSFAEQGNESSFQTYRLRARAAEQEVSLEELARVLFMLNKKRGYKSNRKSNDTEEGQLVDGMAIAKKLYEDGLTPGQYVYSTLMANSRYVPSFYRSDLLKELDAVWSKQSEFYPDVLTPGFYEKLKGRSKAVTTKMFYAVFQITTADNKDKDKMVRLRTAYRWRTEALLEKLELSQVAYVVAEINGQIASSSGYLGAISDHSKELYFNHLTIGQYLMRELEKDSHFRIKNRVYYRSDYLQEFNTIWEVQAQFHPELTDDLKTELRDLVIFYQRRLKSKKGLLAICELEGREIFVPGKRRKILAGPKVCPKSSPLFQEFKIWQTLNNVVLENKTASHAQQRFIPLSIEQKQKVFNELQYCEEIKANDLLKRLGLRPEAWNVNFEKIQGNLTNCAFLKAYQKIYDWSGHDADSFAKMNAAEKCEALKQVFCAIGAQTEFLDMQLGDKSDTQQTRYFKLWHLVYSYEGDSSATGDESLIAHIQQITGLGSEYAAAIAAVNFREDYASVSTKAIMRLMPLLRRGLKYSDACAQVGYRHSKQSITSEENTTRTLASHLDILPKNSLRNPVVEKILNQMIHVVNALSQSYGVPDNQGVPRFDEIHVEMARSLKQNQKQRENATKSIADRTRETEAIVKRIQSGEFGIVIEHPSRNDILRVRLYDELKDNGYKTLYSDTYISHEELFSKKFDIEHIIPQALLFDDSQANKTLETATVNREKGNKTAIDYVRGKYGEQGVEQYMNRIAYLYDRNNSNSKYKHLITTADDINDAFGFLNRDLTDSQYIARKARELLMAITRTVVPTTGKVTARLREDWGLVDVMKELNWKKFDQLGLTESYRNRDGHEVRRIKDWTKRNDHRHHAMDALAVAFTRLEHINYLNNLSAHTGDDTLNANAYALKAKLMVDCRFLPPLPFDVFRSEALRHLDEVLVSIKAKNKVATPNVNSVKGSDVLQVTLTPRSQLHNETVYGCRKRYVTKMEKVGGSFTEEKIMTVARRDHREALLRRLFANQGDAKKAFMGKNALSKAPLWLDEAHTALVPERVKTVRFETIFTIRKPISKDLKLEKVLDEGVRRILQARLDAFGGDANEAFANLDENPIWLNEGAGIDIKRVTITGVAVATPLHCKRDHNGHAITDSEGNCIPADYVSTSGNHHVAIFVDSEGSLHEHVVSYYEAITRLNQHLPVIDRNYNMDDGWTFLFTMKQNEYFVFPNEQSGFDPTQIDLFNPINVKNISANLFRVQKLSIHDYYFRHHLETNVEVPKQLRDVTWKRIQNPNKLKGVVKVRINHIGQIVAVGEY